MGILISRVTYLLFSNLENPISVLQLTINYYVSKIQNTTQLHIYPKSVYHRKIFHSIENKVIKVTHYNSPNNTKQNDDENLL